MQRSIALPDQFTAENTIVAFVSDDLDNAAVLRNYSPFLKGGNLRIGNLIALIDSEKNTATIEEFEIWNSRHGQNLRGRGAGKLLMQACVANIKEMGLSHIHSRSISSAALHVREQVLPSESMQFFLDTNPGKPLSLDISQVIRATEEMETAYRHEHQLNETYMPLEYFGATIDLAKVTTEGWPLAIDYDEYSMLYSSAA